VSATVGGLARFTANWAGFNQLGAIKPAAESDDSCAAGNLVPKKT